jgi:hypothetical protein
MVMIYPIGIAALARVFRFRLAIQGSFTHFMLTNVLRSQDQLVLITYFDRATVNRNRRRLYPTAVLKESQYSLAHRKQGPHYIALP